MGDHSNIEWTEATWNPVVGCSKVSPGCAHCYAEELHRTRLDGRGVYPAFKPWTPANAEHNVTLAPERLDQPLRWTKPRMIFVNSMSDLFHEQVPDEYIARVLSVIQDAQQHTFQVLTKRPERMRDMMNRLSWRGHQHPNRPKNHVQWFAQGVADLRTTPDHKLWVRHSGNHSHPREKARTVEPDWVPAADTLGSYVNLRLPPVEDSPYSAHEWWIVGRWLGDGHFDTRGRVHISCSHDEAPELIDRLGSFAGSAAERRTGTQIAINDRGGRLRALLHRCGRGAGGKHVPGEAVSLNPEKAEALLDGYLSADGHYVKRYDRHTASSVSRPLVLGMALVAQRARRVVASVYAGRKAGTTVIEGRTVNTRDDWVLSIPPRNVSGLILSDGAWKKVRHVKPVDEAEVWDISVADDASFTAEGCIVKNCPLQLEVIRRLVRLYSNPGELVFDPFMGIGSVAAVAIEQGREVAGFELKESYHRQAVRHAERASVAEQSTQQTLEDAA